MPTPRSAVALVCVSPALLSLLVACGAPSVSPDGGASADAGLASDAGTTGTDAGSPADGGLTSGADVGFTLLPASITGALTVGGDVRAPATSVVQPGATLTIQAGARVRFAANATLDVQGTLLVEGTKASWVEFDSVSGTGSDAWAGVSVGTGGHATLAHVGWHHAKTAFTAKSGSQWSVTGVKVDTSSAAFQLASSGTVQYGTVHSLGSAQSASPVAISNASPVFTDVLFDAANSGIDMIVVSQGSPSFDHVEVTQCHCAFHFNSGQNISVKNAAIHDVAYVLMNITAANTHFETSNFTSNTVNIGDCTSGGSFTGSGNYATGAMFDGSCASQVNSAPASSPLTGVGPRAEP